MRDVEPTVEDTGPQHPPEQCPENQDPLLLDPCTEQEAQTATERHAASDHYKVSLQSASSRNSLTYLMHSMHSASAANARVVTYELSTSHEEALARMLAVMLANFHQIGDGVDPFNVIPQYENPELSAVWLQRNCKFC